MNRLSREYIQDLLMRNDEAVGRALVVLYENQTADEKFQGATRHHNDRGFMPQHACVGTSMAKWFMRTGRLTPAQVNWWRVKGKRGSRIGLYWRQLVEAGKAKQKVRELIIMKDGDPDADVR